MMHASWHIFRTFLGFGLLAFGGPVAQIAMIRRELVDTQGWISPERFNRALAVYQALPGPEALELCVYLGMIRAGRMGAVLAGLGFMLPGTALILLLAWAYHHAGPAVILPLFAGVQPAVAALIVRALHRIGQHAAPSMPLMLMAGCAALLTTLGVHFAITLGLCGLAQAIRTSKHAAVWLMIPALLACAAAAYALMPASPPNTAAAVIALPLPLFMEGLKAGLLSFGGAYTAIPFVEAALTQPPYLMPRATVLDGVALASMIPAPLVSFTTFLGYLSGGLAGAGWMTLGVYLPAFLFTLIGHRAVERLIDHPPIHGFLDGIAAGVVGILAVTALSVSLIALGNLLSAALFATSLAAFYTLRGAWAVPCVIVLAGAVGYLS